jgi:hypothetical protein
MQHAPDGASVSEPTPTRAGRAKSLPRVARLAFAALGALLAPPTVIGCAGGSSSNGDAVDDGGDGGPGDDGATIPDGAVGPSCPAPGEPTALLADARAAIKATRGRRASILQDLYGLAADGTIAPGGLTGIDWNPGRSGLQYELLDVERNTPILISNDAPTPPSGHVVFGVAGEKAGQRYVLLGGNPLSDLALTPPAAGSAAAKMDELDVRLVKWLLGKDPGTGAGTKVVLAHLAGYYWHQDDKGTAKFFATKFPAATVNAEDACENGALAGCLTGASLLVLSDEDGTNDDNYKTPADPKAIGAALAAAEAAKVPVLFVSFSDTLTKLGEQIVAPMRVQPHTNYWGQERLKGFSPASLPSTPDALDDYDRTVATLETDDLAAADYAACLNAQSLPGCDAPAFRSKLGDGAATLRSALAAFDAQGTDLTQEPGYDLLRALLRLADAYRAGDTLTYPLDPKSDPKTFARAAFADATVHYAQACNHKQRDLGTFVCDRDAVLAKKCAPYDPATVPRVSGTIDEAFRDGTQWTTTGFYALPGVPFTITRDDAVDAPVEIRLNFQRTGTTRALQSNSSGSNYDRPQYLASSWIGLATGRTVVASSPYGGPVYLQLEGSASVLGQHAKLRIANVARHAALLDIGDPAAVPAFIADLKSNPLPHVDLRGVGFEAHLRKDKLVDALTTPYDLATRPDKTKITIDYKGDLAKLLGDIRDDFILPEFALAGFAGPGRTLDAALSADVKATCTALGWDCLDPSIHARGGTQHMNFDQYANCGDGCSGNPFDADWAITPLGWGESHELGHNLQVSQLQIGYVAAVDHNDWSKYQGRAGENSNNIFPYHNQWRYIRQVLAEKGTLTYGFDGFRTQFAMVQSSRAGLVRTIGGAKRKVVFDHECKLAGDFDPAATDVHVEAIWGNPGYAATNGPRMAFYLGLPFRLQGATLTGGTVLHDGFDIFTLLYDASRLFGRAAGDDAKWTAARDALGFGLFPRTGHATYGGGAVSDIRGNDFILVALARITGLDFRPYFRDAGVRFSDLASSQIDAHVASGLVKGKAPSLLSALDPVVAPTDVSTIASVAPDGVAKWPSDGFHPSSCP